MVKTKAKETRSKMICVASNLALIPLLQLCREYYANLASIVKGKCSLYLRP